MDSPSSETETLVSSTAPDYLNPKLSAFEFLQTMMSGTNKDHDEEEESKIRGRKRRSRWESPPSKRKSRWEDDEPKPILNLPDFMEFDPEIQSLNIRLLEITRILQSCSPLDNRQEGERSPSPEPIYDNNGVRVNTREYRAKEKLNKERQEIISKIINKNPSFKPPADYRPPKLQKKLYIPRNEFPGYSFIGLIIGPRGNTQKRMQKETGAKIVIRGKGSAKEGRQQQKKYDPSDDEELHVLVEAQTKESLDAAVGMVEKLLKPVDELLNEHKRQQLRELATLNGTVRDEEFCRRCGEAGHIQYVCPSSANTFKSDVLCKICGDGGHPTIDCPVKGATGNKMEDEYQNFLAELGGSVPEASVKQSSSTLALGPGSPGSNPPWTNKAGLGSNQNKPSKEYDETNLYIGFLPPRLDDDGLVNLFSPFGEIVMAKVIKDHVSGLSRCYGFVKYADVHMANTAVEAMNGYRLEGKTLAVRISGKQPPPTAPQPPTQAYPPPVSYSTAPFHWGPPSYTPYAPPPLPPVNFSTAPVHWGPPSYTPYAPAPLHGQHMSPYGMHYPPPPPPPQASSPVTASQSPSSSESQRSFPAGVQAENGSPASSVPPNVYISSVSGLPGQPPCISYPSYYNAVPPQPPASSINHSQSMTWANSPPVATSDHSQGLGNEPWAPNPPMPSTVRYSQSMGNEPCAPKPPVQPSAKYSSAVGDSEYEKFMAELM